MDYRQSVAMGQVPGAVPLMITGSAFSIVKERTPFLLSDAQLPPKWETVPVQMEVLSSSTNDSATGTGARIVSIKILDVNYAETIVPITLAGTTPVRLPSTALFVNGAQVTSAGSNETNIGNITIRTTGSNFIKGYIPIGINSDRSFKYTVPAGKTFLIDNFLNTSMKSSSGDVGIVTNLMIRQENGVISKLPDNFTQTTDASINIVLPTPLAVKEKTTIFTMVAGVSITGANYAVTAFGILMDNTVT
jgi:hypothetical protein